MLPSVKVASVMDGAARMVDVAACLVDGAACMVDGAARTKTAHRTFSPLKHFTETRQTRQMHTVLPCVTNIVVHGNDVHRWWFSVAQCEGETAGIKTRRVPHAACRAYRADDFCTYNIVLLCQVKNGSWDIVLHKITLIWCLQTDKIWY